MIRFNATRGIWELQTGSEEWTTIGQLGVPRLCQHCACGKPAVRWWGSETFIFGRCAMHAVEPVHSGCQEIPEAVIAMMEVHES
jgi:hypothetical protein